MSFLFLFHIHFVIVLLVFVIVGDLLKLVSSSSSCSSDNPFEFHIFSPLNHSIIGTRLYLSFIININSNHFDNVVDVDSNYEKNNCKLANPIIEALQIKVNEKIIHQRLSNNTRFYGYLDNDDLFLDGYNRLSIEISYFMLDSDEDLIKVSKSLREEVVLYSIKSSSDAQLDAIIQYLKPGALRFRSYAFFGVTIDSTATSSVVELIHKQTRINTLDWTSFVNLNGERYEIFHSDTKEGLGFCGLMAVGSRTTHCFPLINASARVPEVGFVDYSIIMIDDVIDSLLANAPGDASSAARMVRRGFQKLLQKIIAVTRRGVAALSSVNNLQATRFVENFTLKAVNGDRMFVNVRTIQQGRDESVVVLGKHYVWYLDTSPEFGSGDKISLVLGDQSTSATKPTSMIMNSFKTTRSFILLSNACLLRTSNTVVLFNPDLNSSIVDLPFLASDEDKGFLYSGLRIVEVDAMQDYARDSKLRYMNGMSALSVGVTSGHIVHELEPLLQFLFASMAVSDDLPDSNIALAGNTLLCDDYNHLPVPCARRFNSSKSAIMSTAHDLDENTRVRFLVRKYRHILSRLDNVVLGTLSSENINDWILSVVGIILSSLQDLEKKLGPSLTGHGRTLRRNLAPSLLLKDQLFLDNEGIVDESLQGVCFQELLLLGRSNSHVGFFGSRLVAYKFRNLVYDCLGIQSKDLRHREFSTLPRRKAVRMTFILRDNDRKLINLEDVLKVIRRTSYLDFDWLKNHIYYSFDALPFHEQVKVMANSDIVIAVHGAAIVNGIFMRAGSSVIEIMNGPFFDSYFKPALNEAGVGLFYVPVIDPAVQCFNCPDPKLLPEQCSVGSIVQRTRVDCIRNRSCDVVVNLELFEMALYQAYHHLLQQKWSGDSDFDWYFSGRSN